MPQTRRQRAILKTKVYDLIPPKNDISLFQKSGSCIEGSIFLIIQSFLSIEDYRDLMNCNLATFQPIKYETVSYNLIGPERWIDMDSVHDEKKEGFVLNLIRSVKDRSKQIAMTMHTIPVTVMMKHAHVFAGIHRVRISGNYASRKETIDFNIFNNIHDVYLENFYIASISGGFENVVHLVLSSIHMMQTISNINQKRTLRSLYIKNCYGLRVLDIPFEDIADLNVNCQNLSQLPQLGGQRDLNIVSRAALISPGFMTSLHSTLSTLQSITLMLNFPADFHDFSVFQSISKVRLSAIPSRDNPTLRSFPAFHGKELALSGFNLVGWNQTSATFDSLSSLSLTSCEGLVDFPVMSELVELEISQCNSLKSIPTLMKLKKATLRYVNDLVSIASLQPALQIVDVYNARSLPRLSFESPLHRISLFGCVSITDITPLKHCKDLSVSNCSGITSVAGLSGSSLAADDRKISLTRLSNVSDCCNLCNINELDIRDMALLLSLEGIHHINFLSFLNCYMTETGGLANIRRLSLQSCYKIQRLVGIESIPEIHLTGAMYLRSYEELRDHEVVKVRDQRIFQDLKARQREMNIKTLIGPNRRWEEVTYTLD